MSNKLAAFLVVLLSAFVLRAADQSRTLNPSIGITPTTSSFDRNGGVQGVITSGSGTWYASSSASWIKVTTVSGTAGYTVGYTVDAYNGVEKRTGIVYVSGHVHTVTQTGTAATLASDSAEFAAAGGQGSVPVSAAAGQTWHAQSNVDWIKLTTTSGTGSRTITYTVNAYDEVTTRRGTLTIADNTFTVYQTGRLMKLTSNNVEVDYLGETVKIRANALADTVWSVSEDADWLSIADHGPGLGGGAVKIAIAENPSANARSAVVTIGTESFTIKQLGRTALVFKTDKTELAVDATGGASEILNVTATPDLGWTASANESWIVFSRSSGSGSGSVGFKINANPTLAERRATVTVRATDSRVAVRTLEITQAAAIAELTGSAYMFEAAGESVLVGVSTDAIVGWTLQNPLSWLTVTGATGTGSATLTLTAAANTSVDPRSGVLTIAGIDYAVTQKGQGVSLNVSAKAFDTDGRPTDGSTENVIGVTAAAGVAWTAVASDPTWIAVYVGKSGTGNGTIKYVIAPYVGGGEVREGTITVGDQIVHITQRPYRLSIEPNGERVEPNAGAGEIQVALDINGVWEAIATEPWIQVISGYNSGTGNGKVLFEYTDNNTGKERVGKIVISGTEYTLTQQARQRVAIEVSANGRGGTVAGGGIYGVGDKVTLTAVAESGYVFTNWTLPSGTSTESTQSITAKTAGSYKANFTALPPTILKTENALAGVRLVWTNLAWASTYHIWRGTATSRGAATKIATIAADGECCHRDTTGTIGQQYWYWVEAVGLDDDTWSDGVAATRQRNTFAITYDNLRGTTHANPSSYTEGDVLVFSAPSARRGFTFVGWTPSQIDAETSGDVAVRAIWRQNTYVVRYNVGGRTDVMADGLHIYGFWRNLTSINTDSQSVPFGGWATTAGGSAVYTNRQSVKNLTQNLDDVITLYAVYRPESYIVNLYANGGQGDAVELPMKENVARTLSASTIFMPGSRLAGWATSPEGEVVYEPCAVVSNLMVDAQGNASLYAVWEPALLTVRSFRQRFPWNGLVDIDYETDEREGVPCRLVLEACDSLVGTNLLVTAVSTNAVAPWANPVITYHGRRRLVWNAAADLPDGFRNESISVRLAFIMEVTFETAGGTLANPVRDYVLGRPYGSLPTPTRVGASFAGWYTAPTGGVRVSDTSYVDPRTRTLYARWE